MAKAFLSHRSSDKELVRKVAEQLGLSRCVLDEKAFEVGEKTLDEIYSKLDSCDILVFFLSNAALDSPWIKSELKRAKQNLESGTLDQIYPLVIDKDVKFDDPRIPAWMSKSYNLRYIGNNETTILHKIKQALRSINFRKNKHNQELERLFIGRHNEMRQFDQDINNLENWTPSCIIAHSFYDGIGRRTFLKNALTRYGLVTRYAYNPIQVTIDSKESIESFIYKLNSVNPTECITDYDFSVETLNTKIHIAQKLLVKFIEQNEIIFIIDNGGIVIPNGMIATWFVELIRLLPCNALSLCLVSKFHPRSSFIKQEHRYLCYDIHELTLQETQSLFAKLLSLYNVPIRNAADKELILSHLKGIPAQVIYAVNMLDSSVIETKRNINDIIEYSDYYSFTLLEYIKKTQLAYQITLLLATNEIVGYDLVEEVFGSYDEVHEAIQMLYDLTAFSFVLDGNDHLKLNPALSDYISRSRLKLDSKYLRKFESVRRNLLSKNLDDLVQENYSAFLMTIHQMLQQGRRIPAKYYLPSLVLKYIVKQYEGGEYDKVISMCEDLIQNTNYDNQIISETKYYLLLAYARRSSDRFFDYISDFYDDPVSYHFLRGFYFRFEGDFFNALKEFNEVREIEPDHTRTKREIVNIYLDQERYDDALSLARENYLRQKGNIFHLQSYYFSIIYKEGLDENDMKVIDGLLAEGKRLSGINTKANDIYKCMLGHYQYYVLHNFNLAEATLKEAIHTNENKDFPKKALTRIYKLEKKFDMIQYIGK